MFLDLNDSTAIAAELGPLRFNDFKNDFVPDIAEPVSRRVARSISTSKYPHVFPPRRQGQIFSRGSRTSRSPSPSRFMPSTVSMMPSPGKVEIHHASRR